ncbi:MAG: nitrous oxide reductase accessory protein NosL [Bacillota bacterium]
MRAALWWVFLLLVAGLTMAGCGESGADPPKIKWQEDICDYCRMVIEDRRFAAGYRLETGEQRRFDDIGDMVLFLRAEQGKVSSIWVQSLDDEVWLEAHQAFFVEAAAIESPMGYGLAAVASRERAEALAQERKGEVLTWEQLRERGVKPPRSQ